MPVNRDLAQLALRHVALTLVVATTGTVTLGATAAGYTRTAGSFKDDGFKVGMEVSPAGAFARNTAPGIVASVTDTLLGIRDGCVAESTQAGCVVSSGFPLLRAWENITFTPDVKRPWASEGFIPATSTVVTMPVRGGLMKETGLSVWTFYGLPNVGPYALNAQVTAFLALFPGGKGITLADGTCLSVRSDVAPTAGQITNTATGHAAVQVTIAWRAETRNAPMKATMPGGDAVFELIPAYDQLTGMATSGQRFTVVGSPVVDGDHYDMGPDDALVFDKSVLPVNESASGFTVFTALDLQAIDVDAACAVWELATPDGLYFPAYAQQTNEAGHNNFYAGVTYNLYAGNPSRQEEYVQAVDVPTAPCVVAIRFDRREPTGARLSVFVDGILQAAGPGSSTTGDNTEGLFAVPPTSLFYAGIDPSDEAGGQVAPAFGGYTATIAAALSDTVIAQRCAWIAATHPVTP